MKSIRIITCDERGAAAFDASLSWPARVHVERRGELRSPWEDFHDRGRPNRLGQGPSANAVQRYADEHREPLELSRRFARDVAAWIEVQRRDAGPGSAAMPVFAAPRFLGQLRQALGDAGGGIDLRAGELRTMSAAQLSRHPEIDAIVRRACGTPPLLASARPAGEGVSGAD